MYPGVYWVWYSLTYILHKLCVLIHQRGHALYSDELLYSSQIKSLLKSNNNSIEVDSEGNDLDGHYTIFDSK